MVSVLDSFKAPTLTLEPGGRVFDEVGRDQFDKDIGNEIVVRRSFHRINLIIVEFSI
jgi:hypothetical protein